nr:hypothetical protein [Tanacetum cinerariifolium]
TYTSVYTNSEPGRVFWGADEELSDGGYVAESDLEEDPKEYEEDEDEDEEEEEEHFAPADSAVVIPIDELYEVGESSTRGQGVDYGFANTVEAEMRHRGIREVGYGIRDTWIDPVEAVPEMASTTLEKVNTRVTEHAELHEHDTQDLYALLEDAQDVTDSRDSPSDERHEARDGRHAGRVVSTMWTAEESRTAGGIQIMALVTRQGQNPPPPNTNTPPHHMTSQSMQAMIDQSDSD